MISQELLDILACPSCKGDLEYDASKETLTCRSRHCVACGMPVDKAGKCQEEECGQQSSEFVGLEYRIEDDIPIMLIDEARKFTV